MGSKSVGRIIVGADVKDATICFSVEENTGTSGRNREFIDINVSRKDLQTLKEDIESYLKRTKKD